jgi:hypothetical protein
MISSQDKQVRVNEQWEPASTRTGQTRAEWCNTYLPWVVSGDSFYS